jgi:hypothetical protein
MAGAPADSILQTLLDAIFGVAQTASPGVEP